MGLWARIVDALLINLSFAVVYIFLPLILYRIITSIKRGRQPCPSIVEIAAIAMCTQSIVGPVWALVTTTISSTLEPLAYFIAIIIVLAIYAVLPYSDKTSRGPLLHTPYFMLTAIVSGGIFLRLLDPLHQVALGQSDAYTHLYFIRQIIESGNISNVIYPPGYHWVASLPGMLFPLDPYLIGRYGGAFFGMLLILAVWELASFTRNIVSALVATFLAACFPGSLLLMKTGIGVFANQIGLFLIPVILTQYIKNQKSFREILLLGLFFAGLIISTPMMLINVVLLITGDLVFKLIRGDFQIPAKLYLALAAGLSGMLLIVLSYILLHQDFFLSSVNIVSNSPKPANIMSGFQILFSDFFRLKRIGFGNVLFDTALIGLLLFAIACLASAIVNNNRPFILISAWSLLTLTQTATGLLQFSAYQRAGWELLITLCLLGGFAYWHIFEKSEVLIPVKKLVLLLLFLTSFYSVRNYPHHTPSLSNSEGDIVTLIRFLNLRPSDSMGAPVYWSVEASLQNPNEKVLRKIIPKRPQTLITRQFSNFTYGDPVATLLNKNNKIKHIPVGLRSKLPSLERTGVTLILVDSCFNDKETPKNIPSRSLQPDQLDRFLTARNTVCNINITLQDWITGMDHEKWDISEAYYQDTKIIKINKKEPE